jgi:hypothetical protein
MCRDDAGIRMLQGPRFPFNRGAKATIPWHVTHTYV